MDDVTDDDLIRMYREGDADAFDALFSRHHTSVYNFACTMLRNAAAAEDIMQDAFVAVARTARSYTPQGRFKGWLMRIVRNLALNRIEAERAREALSLDGELSVIRLVPGGDPLPSRQVEIGEQCAIVRHALAGLPDRQREAIALYAYEQMTYREIAEVLAVPISTVKTLIRRGRARLARAVEPILGEQNDAL